MLWKPSPKAIQAAVGAYISDKGIKAVLEAAINVDRPIVDLSAIRTGRSRQPAIAKQSRSIGLPPEPGEVGIDDGVVRSAEALTPSSNLPPAQARRVQAPALTRSRAAAA